MTGADEQLVVMLEARISEFEKRMAQAERRGERTYNGLQRGSRRATRQMESDLARGAASVNSNLASMTAGIGRFAGALAGGFLAGGAIALIEGIGSAARQSISALAALGDEAKRAGLSAEAFQEWKYVATQNRIPVDALVDGFKELSLRADELIQTGGGPAAEAFGRLGYSATDLAEKLKDPSALMLEIVGRMGEMDKAAQIRVADEIFGGTGGERFVQLLEQGQAGIEGQIDRARELGIVMDAEMIGKAQELDAKFAEVGDRLASVFRTGVVEAAIFFNLIGDFNEEIKEQKISYTVDVSTEEVMQAIREVGRAIPDLLDAGADDLALRFSDIIGQMETLAGQFDRGEIEAQAFEAAISEAQDELRALIGEAEKVNGVDMSGAVSAVDDLTAALQVAFGWARGVAMGLDAISGRSFAGKEADDLGVGAPAPVTSPLAPSTSPRPRGAPPLLGEPDTGGRAAGGGGGSSRIDALLDDLQTEREIVTAWYEEALELLNGATDAQLEAIGGRHEALERLEREHVQRLAGIQGEGQAGGLAMAGEYFGALANLASAGGDKMAKAARIFGALEAAANVGRAQAQVLADPLLPWWKKIPAALAVGAAGLRIVTAIRGGGVASSGGAAVGGGSSAATTSSESTTQPMRVLLEGIDPVAMYQGSALIKLVDGITKEFGNRGVILTYGARQ